MIVPVGNKKYLPQRYFANVIDYIIVFVLLGMYAYAFGEPNDHGGYSVTGMKFFGWPLIWFLYFPVCESFLGQTIGKKAFGLQVVDATGDNPGLVQAFLRRLFDPFELVFFGAPAVIAINYSPKNQRLGDMVAGTQVIVTTAACRFCGEHLELTSREVINNVFRCPKCDQIN